MKIYKKIICAVLMSIFFPVLTSAAGSIDMSADTSLTIHAVCGEKVPEGMELCGYLISNIEENGELTVTEPFADYREELDIRGKNDSAWENVAGKLETVILGDTSLKAAVSAKTDKKGTVQFEDISMGLYLFLADSVELNDKVYTASPFFVMLPGKDAETDSWQYDVTVNMKTEENPVCADYKVVKIWEDSCHQDQRPKSIEIVLWCDGREYDKVTLPEDGRWQHIWKDLETGHKWSVTEKQQDGYKKPEITQKGYTFTVRNICSKTTAGTSSSKLPQTGQLWWPVPILLCAGLLLIVAGLIRRKGADNEKE